MEKATMKKNWQGALCAGVMLLGLSTTTHAILIDRDNGMVYDNQLKITWLADANYAQTSGHDSDGLMDWSAATTWANDLEYGGFNDWRLPTTLPSDPSCDVQGYNCTGSEMGYMFYENLGGVARSSISSAVDPNNYLNLFDNLQSFVYWSGTEHASANGYSWGFDTYMGFPNYYHKDGLFYVWAVRPGDVAGVPAPATLLLFGFGLAGLGVARSGRHQR